MKTTFTILTTIGIAISCHHQSLRAEAPATEQVESKEELAKKCVQAIWTQLYTFELINGRLPAEDEGISALVVNPDPANLPRWKQLLNEIPIDPWGRNYVYRLKEGTRRGFIVFSLGADPDKPEGIITTK